MAIFVWIIVIFFVITGGAQHLRDWFDANEISPLKRMAIVWGSIFGIYIILGLIVIFFA